MSTSFVDVSLALTPPLIVLILMVGFRWGGSSAGTMGWLAAFVLAALRFGAGGEVLFYAHIRSIVLSLDVVYIVWMALLLYYVVNQAGSLKVIADWFTRLTGDDVLRVLLLGWVFTSFLQGVGGFGVPVAIAAPLLVSLGLQPLAAIIVPSIGHAWAVTFGSLGSAFIAMLGVTGLPAAQLAPPAAVLLGAGALACGMLAVHAYGGWSGLRRGLPAVLTIGGVMAAVQYIVATNGLWNISSAAAGLAGLLVGVWVTRWSIYRRAAAPEMSAAPAQTQRPSPTFPMAIAGYMILIVLAILIKSAGPVNDVVSQVSVSISIPEVATSKDWVTSATPHLGIDILAHTGAVLLYSAAITYFGYKRRGYYPPDVERTIIKGVWQKGIPPAVGILSMVAMATLMASAGMTRTIAEWLSQAVPADLYAFVAALIGALGAFMTGSNTNSNAVFSVLQMDTAALLGLSVPMVLATQTAAAGIVSLLAPAKIMVGASTVGMGGNEGVVLRGLLLYGGGLLLFIAALSFILLRLGY